MIIVTGGAGFIGSNIIAELNRIGCNDILVIDNLKNGTKYINLVNLNISHYMDKKDFISKITANIDFGNIEVVFHEGACSSTTEWDGRYIMNNNYQYSKDLLDYCVKRSIPFLYASSAAIYGNRVKNFIEDRKYEKPLNIYSYSKFLFDQYVRILLQKTRSQICGFRYFNVYGPHESHKENTASIMYQLNNQIISNKNLKLFTGSENFKRDFVYISDVVAVNLWCWKRKISGIFNCGTGQAESFKMIADAVIKYHQRGHLEYIPFPKKLQGRYQAYTQANLTRLQDFGYNQPFTAPSKGVTEYLNWLEHNC